MAKPLNAKQLKFVERYLETRNATQSYIDAGYTKDRKAAKVGASKLLTNPNVKALVSPAREAAATATASAVMATAVAAAQHAVAVQQAEVKATEINAPWILERMAAEAVLYGEGSSHSARVKALELLGRRFGLFPQKIEHSGSGGGPIHLNFARLPDDDLTRLITVLALAVESADSDSGDSGAGESGTGSSQALAVRTSGLGGGKPGANPPVVVVPGVNVPAPSERPKLSG